MRWGEGVAREKENEAHASLKKPGPTECPAAEVPRRSHRGCCCWVAVPPRGPAGTGDLPGPTFQRRTVPAGTALVFLRNKRSWP